MPQRLFEAIIDANHRAVAGDTQAGLHPDDYVDELPLVALSCVDVRLNALLPQALGVPAEQFIWLRNAGNIVTGPMSSTMRSLALACAIKGGKSIVVIGHTDCQVGKTSSMQLLDRFRALGIERHLLPDNLNEFFGMFGSERQNVLKAVEFVRASPLIGPKIPVHGLLVDVQTGRVEWLVNGYEALNTEAARQPAPPQVTGLADVLKPLAGFNLGALKFPDAKIGEVISTVGKEVLQSTEQRAPSSALAGATQAAAAPPPALSLPTGFNLGELRIAEAGAAQTLSGLVEQMAGKLGRALEPAPGQSNVGQQQTAPPRIPIPPPIRAKMHLRRNPK